MSVEGNLVESASLTLIANGALTWRGDHELYGTYLSPFFFGPVLIVPHARVFLRGEVGFEGETTLVTRQNLTSTVRLLYDGGWRDDGSGFSCSGVAVRIEDIGSQCVDTENASLLRGKRGSLSGRSRTGGFRPGWSCYSTRRWCGSRGRN